MLVSILVFYILSNDGNNLIHSLYEILCVSDGLKYPYNDNDFEVKLLKRCEVEIIQINFPECNKEINDILRVYVLYGKLLCEKYFLIKRFVEDGKIFICHVSAQGECLLGQEITEDINDIESEYSKLLVDYMKLLILDFVE